MLAKAKNEVLRFGSCGYHAGIMRVSCG